MREQPPEQSQNSAEQLRAVRLAQLRAYSSEDIDGLMARIRAIRTIPKLAYHLKLHGPQLGTGSEEEYLRALEAHLQRDDLRVFTFLRIQRREPLWAIVAPDTGNTVLYNEDRQRVWSFYRPTRPSIRMRSVESVWIEIVKRDRTWQLEEHWTWDR